MKSGLKNPLMRITNLILYLSFCGLIGTGALIEWRLVPGSEGGHGLRVLDLGRHEWGDIHFWLAVTCMAATVTHLFLNWAWLKKIASSGKAWRLFIGLGAGATLIFGIYFLPMENQRGDRSDPNEERRYNQGE